MNATQRLLRTVVRASYGLLAGAIIGVLLGITTGTDDSLTIDLMFWGVIAGVGIDTILLARAQRHRRRRLRAIHAASAAADDRYPSA